jgi:hypothetical protein
MKIIFPAAFIGRLMIWLEKKEKGKFIYLAPVFFFSF